MKQKLIEFLGKINYKYIEIDNEQSLKIIYDLFLNGIIQDYDISDPIIYYYYGIYYRSVKDYDKMEIYYLLAFEKGIIIALVNLAQYYDFKVGDCEKADKYYKMAHKNGCSDIKVIDAMAEYYEHKHSYCSNKIKKEKYQKKTIKYYKMVIEYYDNSSKKK